MLPRLVDVVIDGMVGGTVLSVFRRPLPDRSIQAAANLATQAGYAKAFAKVTLQPNDAQDVTFTLDMRALAYFDDTRQAWVADTGAFDLLIGTSSVDLPHKVRVHLAREWVQPVNGAHGRG